MSENDIKPVAWVDLDVWISTNDAGDSFFTDYQDEDTVAVYDQSAIDRLTAELKLVSGERNRVQLKWDEFRQTKNAEVQRLAAERDAAVADARELRDFADIGKNRLIAAAKQARRCLAWACDQRPEFNAEYEALDAAIDCARSETE